ncbi:MAG: hypothetical protein V3T77_01115 [Planctomycetota bacterium]
MAIDSRDEVITILRRFALGELSSGELLRYVRSLELGFLDELLDHIQLRTTDYGKLGLTEKRLAVRVAGFLEGITGFGEFRDWTQQLYRIYASSEYQFSDSYSREIEKGLMLLALLVDVELTEQAQRSKHLVRFVYNALERGHTIPNELILRKLYSGKQRIHLVTRQTGEAPHRPWKENQWADVALVNSPGTLDELPGTACWFVPLAVCTQGFWLESPPEGAWGHPENDKMFQLLEEFPNLALQALSHQYFVDPDGLVEVVLDVDEIGPQEIAAAVRLFCLRNQVRCCDLDGQRIYPTKEER